MLIHFCLPSLFKQIPIMTDSPPFPHSIEQKYEFRFDNPTSKPHPDILLTYSRVLDLLACYIETGRYDNRGEPLPCSLDIWQPDPYPTPQPGDCRPFFASLLSEKFTRTPLTHQHIVITLGCRGAMNVALRAFLDEGEKVLLFAPFYPEYPSWISNYTKEAPVVVPVEIGTWEPDCMKIREALDANPEIRVVILNSPNNPTGAIWSEQTVRGIAAELRRAARRGRRPIWLVVDSVYVNLCNVAVKFFDIYRYTVACYSTSKDWGFAKMPAGCLVTNPNLPGTEGVDMAQRLWEIGRGLGHYGPSRITQLTLASFHTGLTGGISAPFYGPEWFGKSFSWGMPTFYRDFVWLEMAQVREQRSAGQTAGCNVCCIDGTVFGWPRELGEYIRISRCGIVSDEADAETDSPTGIVAGWPHEFAGYVHPLQTRTENHEEQDDEEVSEEEVDEDSNRHVL
jgi:hypothetical protein